MVVVCGSGYGHRTAHTATHFCSCVGSFPGPGTRGMFPGQHVFMGTDEPRRVSFASDVTVLVGAPQQDNSRDIGLHDPLCPEIVDEDEMDTVCATNDITAPIVQPPPGFRQFSWPREEWSVGGEPSLFDFAKGLPGWFPWIYGEQPVDLLSLPVLPILPGSWDDSVIAVESSREESNTLSETVVVTQPVGDALRVEMDSRAPSELPSPDVGGTCSDLPLGPVADSQQGMTNHTSRRSLSRFPRWRLTREGPFLAERSSSSLCSFGAGCAFWNTTYRASDYASPSGEFGIPSTLLRVGWRSKVGWSVGDGTWEVAQRDVKLCYGSSYGRSHTVTSGRFLDDHEFGCSGSVRPLTAGHSVKDSAGGPQFQ